MSDKDLFSFNEYKDFLRHYVKTHRAERGCIRRMAEAAGCQRSYMSQILGTHVHLTREQAWALCALFGLNDLEVQYFMALVEYARSGTKKYRESVEALLRSLRQKHDDLSERTTRARIESQDQAQEYYYCWNLSAIQILVSIPEYQTVSKIAVKLSLDKKTVESALLKLAAMGLVAQEKERWSFRRDSIHIPKNSPYVAFHHRNWRDRAVLSAQHLDNEAIHYTMIQSVSRDALPKIRQIFLDAIEQANAVASPSTPQELLAIDCDLFLL